MLVRYLSTILGYGKGLLQFAVKMCKCGKLGPQPGRLLGNGRTLRKLGHWSFVLEEDAGSPAPSWFSVSRPSQISTPLLLSVTW